MTDKCWCEKCDLEEHTFRSRMSTCPECGNKRCPRAKDHLNACTGTAVKESLTPQTQEWAEMDGVTAFHMIRRHAYDRSEIGVMMEVWRRANSPAWHDAPTVPGLWINSSSDSVRRVDQHDIDHLMKTPPRGWRWYGPIPADGDKP